MKKLYLDMTDYSCKSAFVKDAEVVPAGTTMYSMPVTEKSEEYDALAAQYDIHFIFDDQIPAMDFYSIPRIDILATDSRGGFLGTLGEISGLDSKAPICYIDQNRNCFKIATDLKALLDRPANWREKATPCEDVVLFGSREEAMKAHEFIKIEEDMSGEDTMKEIVKVIFSPTGGTKRVADILAEGLGKSSRMVDLGEPGFSGTQIGKDELAVIAVPSYAGRVPAVAVERISKIRGNQAKCVIVCVYGNRAYEDTLVELEDVAVQSGFQVIAAIAAVAEHSIMHQYAAGRPDQRDIEELKRYAGRILAKMNDSDSKLTEVLPGNRPYKKAGGVGMVPKAGSACNGCGLCAEKCPVQAIRKEQIKTADPKLCISCMRCVQQCPQAARKVNGTLVSAAALAMKKVCSVRKECELYL